MSMYLVDDLVGGELALSEVEGPEREELRVGVRFIEPDS
jgi:hypothetical protein